MQGVLHCPNGVKMFTTLLQHCQHCPALSRYLKDDIRPMFKQDSHQHRYGSEMLTRQGFDRYHELTRFLGPTVVIRPWFELTAVSPLAGYQRFFE